MQVMAGKGINDSQPDLDEKLADPLIRQPLDKHYAVNWADHTETDHEYVIAETKKWWRKERAE